MFCHVSKFYIQFHFDVLIDYLSGILFLEVDKQPARNKCTILKQIE